MLPDTPHSRRLVLQLAGATLLTGIAIASADAPETPEIAAPEPSPAGNWLAEDILGGGVLDNAQTTIEIAADGTVSGNGGCNRFSGKATIDAEKITFGALASTRMACAEALMNQETKFHDALTRAASFRLEAAGDKLVFLDASGEPLVRLAAT